MRAIIIGCGRLGSTLAARLDQEGHAVTVVDIDPYAFERLPQEFGGQTVLGNGIDPAVLGEAGITQADALVAATHWTNLNVMAAQIAKEVYRVPRVVARHNDPIRGELFADLGLVMVCPALLGANAIYEVLHAPQQPPAAAPVGLAAEQAGQQAAPAPPEPSAAAELGPPVPLAATGER